MIILKYNRFHKTVGECFYKNVCPNISSYYNNFHFHSYTSQCCAQILIKIIFKLQNAINLFAFKTNR